MTNLTMNNININNLTPNRSNTSNTDDTGDTFIPDASSIESFGDREAADESDGMNSLSEQLHHTAVMRAATGGNAYQHPSQTVLTKSSSSPPLYSNGFIKLTPIFRLPPELLATVMTYLSSRTDQRAAMLVCKTWFSSAAQAIWFRPQISNEKTLTKLMTTLKTPEDQLIIPYGFLVRRLNFTGVANIVDDDILLGALSCTDLERITLASCTKVSDRSLVPLIYKNPNIQSIDISGLDQTSNATISALAATCRRLQGLYATGCKLITDESVVLLATNCRQMKRIKLNGCPNLTDQSVQALIKNCPYLVEMDLAGCPNISDGSVSRAFLDLSQLREVRLALNTSISDDAFLNIPKDSSFDKLRIIDLTGCVQVTDDSVNRLVTCAPRLRNLVLAKCTNITDRGVQYVTRLGKSLHYLHLGHCSNITDRSISQLVKACHRIQYIDVACCTQLTNNAVKDLGSLPKLRRIGLVKCQNITDTAIYALAQRRGNENTLERIHLSYCGNITLYAVMLLVNTCERLTHLSLTGVPAFMRHDLTQYCRPPPPEFTQHQQAVFCVFSGDGVRQLREHLNKLAFEQRRLGGTVMDRIIVDANGNNINGAFNPAPFNGVINVNGLPENNNNNNNNNNIQFQPQIGQAWEDHFRELGFQRHRDHTIPGQLPEAFDRRVQLAMELAANNGGGFGAPAGILPGFMGDNVEAVNLARMRVAAAAAAANGRQGGGLVEEDDDDDDVDDFTSE